MRERIQYGRKSPWRGRWGNHRLRTNVNRTNVTIVPTCSGAKCIRTHQEEDSVGNNQWI